MARLLGDPVLIDADEFLDELEARVTVKGLYAASSWWAVDGRGGNILGVRCAVR